MKPVAMSSEWPEVFAGPAWKALLLQTVLEERGIPAFIPDANIQGIDPFIRTGQVFDLHVLVPRDRLDEALEVVADAEHLGDVETDESATPSDGELARLEDVGRRIHWAASYIVFAPYGLWLATSYFPAVKKLGARPRGHGYTIFTTALCAFWLLMAAAVYFIVQYANRRGIP